MSGISTVISFEEWSVIPSKWNEKYIVNGYNPAKTAYNNPSTFQTNFVKFVKAFTEYNNFQKLKVAEEISHSNGSVLVPSNLMHSRRKQKFLRINVGYNAYYVVPFSELTNKEKEKLKEFQGE